MPLTNQGLSTLQFILRNTHGNVAREKAYHLTGAWIVQCGSGPRKRSFCGCNKPNRCNFHGGQLCTGGTGVHTVCGSSSGRGPSEFQNFPFLLTPSLLLFLLLLLKWISDILTSMCDGFCDTCTSSSLPFGSAVGTSVLEIWQNCV